MPRFCLGAQAQIHGCEPTSLQPGMCRLMATRLHARSADCSALLWVREVASQQMTGLLRVASPFSPSDEAKAAGKVDRLKCHQTVWQVLEGAAIACLLISAVRFAR